MRALISLQERVLNHIGWVFSILTLVILSSMAVKPKTLRQIMAVLGLLSLAMPSTASQLVDIYRAEVLVASQSVSARNTAARQAMSELIGRVSGSMDTAKQPAIVSALSKAQTYLQEFSYASTEQQLEVEGQPVPAILLQLKFSAQGIERLLRDANLPLWPANRPKVLIWLVSKDTHGSYSRVAEEQVLLALTEQAGIRGLPIVLPTQDFEDTIALPSESLWELDEALIQQASERYQADAILIGRYQLTNNGQWQASWQLFHSSGQQAFKAQGLDAPPLFTYAINVSADYFAGLYAIVPRTSDPDIIVMRIDDLNSFADFKNVQRYLEGLAMVKRVEMVEVAARQEWVRLYLEGDQALLLSTLALGKKLFPVAVDPVSRTQRVPIEMANLDRLTVLTGGLPPPLPVAALGSINNPLTYRWQP